MGEFIVKGDDSKQFLQKLIVNDMNKLYTGKAIYSLIRFPLAVFTYVIAQAVSRPVRNLEDKITYAGFDIDAVTNCFLDAFQLVCAYKK